MDSKRIKILFITNYKGLYIFVTGLRENLKKAKDVEITIFDYGEDKIICDDLSEKNMFSPFWRKIISFKKTRLLRFFSWRLHLVLYKRALKKELAGHDLIHILYLSPFLHKYSGLLKKSGKKIVVSFMGSDFYRVSEKQRKKSESILNLAQKITFNNPETRDQFLKVFGTGYSDKTFITGFGLSLLENIKKIKSEISKESLKEKHGIAPQDIVITCGYNGSPRQQHNIIIEKLIEIKSQLPGNITLLFPVTYGLSGWVYYNDLKNRLNHSEFKYKLIGNPELPPLSFSNDQIAEIRIISDIVINIQVSDQASASLLEHLYAGSVVIAGDWLPYSFWNEFGLSFIKTTISDLTINILKVFYNFNTINKWIAGKSETLFTACTWRSIIKKWVFVFEDLEVLK